MLRVRHSRRHWHNVPVNMCVALVAAERKDVRSRRTNFLANSFSDSVHDALKLQVFGKRKRSGDLLTMRLRGDECVSEDARVFVEKCNCRSVFIDDVGREFRMPRDDLADEARTGTCALVVRRPIDFEPFVRTENELVVAVSRVCHPGDRSDCSELSEEP